MAGGGEVSEEKSREMVSSSAGFCYSEVSTGHPAIQTHMGNQIPGFVSDPDMFNFTTSMDMIGFSKNLHPQTDTTNALMWKTFLPKAPHHPGPSSSKTITDSVSNNFYPNPNDHYNKAIPDFASGISETTSDNLIHHDSSATWQDSNRLLVDDSSLRCVFPCEGNERPSQGLSLSLSSSNPLSIGLQSFELRHTNDHAHAHAHPHQHQPDFVSSASRDKLLGKSVNPDANVLYQPHYVLKNSKYLAAAQELLYEFCSLGTKQSDHVGKQKSSSQKNKQWEDDNGSGPSKKHPVGSLEFVELQKRKTKLLSMLEEVERRYRHYCSQMKGVVSSFEAVAGSGAARVYSALALKAMSRHFRCLKDGILGELEATRRSMGEKDPVAPGTTKGETPRLRILDQALRQQRAFQQMSMMESHPWRPQRGLPERSVSLLRAWLFEHFLHPYPSDMDKHILARQTGLSRSQVSNWFINARVRLWKPMVEEMYLEEVKEQEQEENNMKVGSSEGVPDAVEGNTRNVGNAAPTLTRLEDQKPIQDQRLLRIDSDCVSSIINNDNLNHPAEQKKDSNAKNQHHNINNDPQGQDQQCAFGCVELDFSSYTHNQHSGGGGMVSYSSRNENFSSGGVSLTLGLQQQGGSGSGVSLAFPPPTHQGSLFYARDQMEECQGGVHYSLLDAEPQNLPYRNLMGAQLLHDLAG